MPIPWLIGAAAVGVVGAIAAAVAASGDSDSGGSSRTVSDEAEKRAEAERRRHQAEKAAAKQHFIEFRDRELMAFSKAHDLGTESELVKALSSNDWPTQQIRRILNEGITRRVQETGGSSGEDEATLTAIQDLRHELRSIREELQA